MTKNVHSSILGLNTDLSKVTFNKSTGYFNEPAIVIDGQACNVIRSARLGIMWIRPVNEPKTAKTARKSSK